MTPNQPTDSQTLDVLVVDDDNALRTAIAGILEDDGLVVAAAAGGKEALSLLTRHKRARVVLIDIWMPGMDGSALLHELASREATALLRKPFTASQLHAAIEVRPAS